MYVATNFEKKFKSHEREKGAQYVELVINVCSMCWLLCEPHWHCPRVWPTLLWHNFMNWFLLWSLLKAHVKSTCEAPISSLLMVAR